MSELSEISTETVATTRSPTDNTMMLGVTEKPATSSSFSERVKNAFGNFLPFTKRTGTGDDAETQEEKEDVDGHDDFGSQVNLNSLTQENDAYTDREAGTMDQFGVEDNKQDHKRIRPVRRHCEHDEFGNANFEE